MKGSWLFRMFFAALLLLAAIAPVHSGPGLLSIRTATAAELPSLEATCEDLVSVLVAGDFKQAKVILKNMRGDFRRLDKQLEGEGYSERKQRELAVMHMWLREIELAIRHHSAIGGAIAANQLNAALIRYQDFPDKMKAATEWLDYLAREIELLNTEDATGNASLLELRRNDMTATWQKMRGLLLNDLRNKPLVMSVDSLVKSLDTDTESISQIRNARQLQKLMAQLEERLETQP